MKLKKLAVRQNTSLCVQRTIRFYELMVLWCPRSQQGSTVEQLKVRGIWIPTSLSPKLKSLCYKAMHIKFEARNPWRNPKWFRFSRSEIEKYRDGISLYTGLGGFKAWYANTFRLIEKSGFKGFYC